MQGSIFDKSGICRFRLYDLEAGDFLEQLKMDLRDR